MRKIITESEYKLVKKIAEHTHYKWRRVSSEDIAQELFAYLLLDRTYKYIQKYRVNGEKEKLSFALYRRATYYCKKEVGLTRKAEAELMNYYTIQTITNALPFFFEQTTTENTTPGGELSTLILDIGVGFTKLNNNDRSLLTLKYVDGYSNEELGKSLGISSDGARKKVKGIIEKLTNIIGNPHMTFDDYVEKLNIK